MKPRNFDWDGDDDDESQKVSSWTVFKEILEEREKALEQQVKVEVEPEPTITESEPDTISYMEFLEAMPPGHEAMDLDPEYEFQHREAFNKAYSRTVEMKYVPGLMLYISRRGGHCVSL